MFTFAINCKSLDSEIQAKKMLQIVDSQNLSIPFSHANVWKTYPDKIRAIERDRGKYIYLCFYPPKIDHAGIIKLLPQWRKTMISDQALQEFKMIWRAETGQEITDKEALDAAVAFLHLFDVIYRPIPKTWSDEYDNDNHTHQHGTA